jgi:hypothetical protein
MTVSQIELTTRRAVPVRRLLTRLAGPALGVLLLAALALGWLAWFRLFQVALMPPHIG